MLIPSAARAVRWLAVVVLFVPATAAALEPSDFSLLGEARPASAGMDLGFLAQATSAPADAPAAADAPSAAAETPAASEEPVVARPNHLLGALVAAASVTGSALNSFLDNGGKSFHFHSEGWFGEHTKLGGADKAAHFVDYYIISRELTFLYAKLGYSTTASRWLGFGVAALTGLTTEIGDGTNQYGFSYEDLIADVTGAATATLVQVLGVDDLVGFRHGFIPPAETRTCCQEHGLGRTTPTIYTGISLAGLARRLGWNIGPPGFSCCRSPTGARATRRARSRRASARSGSRSGELPEILDDLGAPRSLVGLRRPHGARQHPLPVHRGRLPVRPEPQEVARARLRRQLRLLNRFGFQR
jgi:hypothetical protein